MKPHCLNCAYSAEVGVEEIILICRHPSNLVRVDSWDREYERRKRPAWFKNFRNRCKDFNPLTPTPDGRNEKEE